MLALLQEGMYFQRIRFDMTDIVVGTANASVLERAIAEVPLQTTCMCADGTAH